MKINFKSAVYLISVLLLAAVISCSSANSVYIKDDLGQNQPKGYISFFSDLQDVRIYRIENNKKIKELEISHPLNGEYSEYRIAKVPGKYGFIIRRLDYTAEISVNILPNMITGVTIKILYVSQSAYYVITTVGSHPIPFLPEKDTNRLLEKNILASLHDALNDADTGTRIKAILELSRVKNQLDSNTIAILQGLAANDRYKRVRDEAGDLLSSIGKLIAEPKPFYFDTFENGFGWPKGNSKEHDLYFDQYGYNIDNFVDSYYVSYGYRNLETKKNYDILCNAIWKSGVKDAGFGLWIGDYDDINSYHFLISRNGGACALKYVKDKYYSTLIPWNNDPKANINSDKIHHLKVEVRDNNYTYFVNDVKIGSFVSQKEDYCQYGIGMIVDRKQNVCFSLMKIVIK